MSTNVITFEGSNCFRQRIILSTLSLRPIVIKNIRLKDDEPGLRDYEINLLKLLEKLTNGSSYRIDETGTKISIRPGILIGGDVQHDCGLQRSISYYLEVVLAFAAFCKQPLNIRLTGITNDSIDVSVDSIKHCFKSVYQPFLGIYDLNDIEIKIISRGLRPNGGGLVELKCPIRKTVKPVCMLNEGKIRRIRGVAFATRVSPNIANRIVTKAKEYLLKFIPDVYIYTDHLKGEHAGKSPGFGLALVAETTSGTFYTGDAISNESGSGKEISLPEDIAITAVHSLFEDIYRGGCFSTCIQSLVTLFMAIGSTDISKIKFGPLSPYSIQFLRHMKEFFQLTFKLEIDQESELNNNNNGKQLRKGSQKVIATCLGIGLTNLSKIVT